MLQVMVSPVNIRIITRTDNDSVHMTETMMVGWMITVLWCMEEEDGGIMGVV